VSAAEECVIYNPAAGRGRAVRRLEKLRRTLCNRAEFVPTQGPAHAEELARKAVLDGFAVVGAAGGDGTVHEVANGLLQAQRPEVALAVYPVGSANDYAHSLGLDAQWWLRPDAEQVTRAVDVGLVRASNGRERFFVNGLGLGFNGAVTLESRRVRRLQGVMLYSVALLRALWYHYTFPVMSVCVDEHTRQGPTLALTVAIGRREGNFVLAPNAVLDDGLFDCLLVGRLPRWRLVLYVPGMITGKLPTDHPALWTGRGRQIEVHSEQPVPVHLDGELFSRPEDGLGDFQIQILPGRLRVRSLIERTQRT
jgi:YegS/Rv2252/BmrU family lipid kinase